MKNKIPADVVINVIVLILALTITIIIGFVPDWSKMNFTTADQVIISIVLFTAFLLIDVLVVVSIHSARNSKEHQFWTIHNEGELLLSNIKSNYFIITKDAFGPKDLYTVYFLEEFDVLAHKIKEAAEAQFLRMTENHLFVSAGLFEPSTYGGNDIVIRYTWPIYENKMIFEDYPWRSFFEQLTIKAKDGYIKAINVIIIVDDRKLLEASRTKMFLDFMQTNKGWNCRVMTTVDYANMCIDSHIPQTYLDFGIYGQNLLYRTEQATPTVAGVFTKDAAAIRKYINFFDRMWNSAAISSPNPSKCTVQISLEEFLQFDAEEPIDNMAQE